MKGKVVKLSRRDPRKPVATYEFAERIVTITERMTGDECRIHNTGPGIYEIRRISGGKTGPG